MKRFGIIGCGRIAPRHADSLAEISDAKLVAVCDVIENRARHFSEKYEIGYTLDYHELISDLEVDVVNICMPSGMHVEMAIAALKAGKHVI